MSDFEIAQDNYRYYQFCREQGHDQYLRNAEQSLAFFIGQQWSDEELSKMRESGRPALTLNQFFRNIDSIVGEMIYATGDVRYSPLEVSGDDVSSVLDKVYTSINQINKVEYLEPALILSGLLTGRAYYDVRVDFDENMRGQVKIAGKRAQNIILNPTIESPDPDTWPEVFDTQMVGLDEIALTYGAAAAQEIEDTPQSDWLSPYDLSSERLLSMQVNGGWWPTDSTGDYFADPRLVRSRRLITRQFRELAYREFFVDTQTGDMSQVPIDWDRDRIQRVMQATGVQVLRRRTKVIRWHVTCDRFVLHNEESPYKNFTIVPFFPYFIDGYPMSLGDQLVDMQRMTNKLYSQVLHILNSAANSGWKYKVGSLKSMTPEELETRGAETGLVVGMENVDDLERIQPGQLPSGHDALAQTISSMFKDISGYTTTMQGADRADASAKSLDSKLARGQVNLATPFKALYHTKAMVARNALNLVQDYYSETRLIHITHGYGNEKERTAINQPTPEGAVLNDVTSGKYIATVIPAPSRETVMQTTFQQLKDMRLELGMRIPDSVLIQYSAIPDKSQVLDALQNNTDPQAQQQQQQLQQQLAQAELAVKQAQAENSSAQGQLAKARSLKAVADAQSNPQADRIALDRERLQLEQQRDQRRDQMQQGQHDTDAALQLTDMHLNHQRETQRMQQDDAHHAQDTALTAATTGLAHARATRESHKDTVMRAAETGLTHSRETRKLDLQDKQITATAEAKKAQAKKPQTPTTPRGKGA